VDVGLLVVCRMQFEERRIPQKPPRQTRPAANPCRDGMCQGHLPPVPWVPSHWSGLACPIKRSCQGRKTDRYYVIHPAISNFIWTPPSVTLMDGHYSYYHINRHHAKS